MTSRTVVVAALRIALLLAILGVWEWAGRAPIAFGFPPASATFAALARLVASSALPAALALSGRAFLLGFGAAVAVGVPLGLLMGTIAPLGRVARLYLDLMIALPMVALVPLVILGFGVSTTSSATIVLLFSMPFIASNAYGGVRDASPRLLDMAGPSMPHRRRSSPMSSGRAPSRWSWPACATGCPGPSSASSWRSCCWRRSGSGGSSSIPARPFAFDQMFATVLAILAVAVVLLAGVERLERRALHWRFR